MRKKIFSILLAAAMAVGLLAGCGDGKETKKESLGGANDQKEETDGKSQVEDSQEEVTLQFLANETPLLTRDFWQTIADKYHEKNPNVTIEIIYQPSANVDVREHAKTLLSTGQFPDILVMTTASDFVSANALLPLEDADVDMVKEEYISRIGGEIYVVPYKIQTGGVFYNKDMFAEYNLEVPTTWEEFETVCETFYDAGVTPIIMGLKDAGLHVVPFSLAAANETLKDDSDWPMKRMNGEVTFANDEGIRTAAKEYALMMNKYNAPDKSSITYAQSIEYFYNQKAPMFIMGSWLQGTDAQTEHEFETGFFPLPGKGGKTVMPLWVNEGLSISAETEYPDIAKDFVRFFLEDAEWSKMFLESEQLFSPLKEPVSYESTLLHAEVENCLNEMEGRPNFFDQVGDNAWKAGISDLLSKTTLDLAASEGVDIEEALQNLDTEVDKILSNE